MDKQLSKLIGEMAASITWMQKLMATNPSKANRVLASAKHHATSVLGCAPQDVDRVMFSQVEPFPKTEKDQKILFVCLEYLHNVRHGPE